jgi:hypothetical protein
MGVIGSMFDKLKELQQSAPGARPALRETPIGPQVIPPAREPEADLQEWQVPAKLRGEQHATERLPYPAPVAADVPEQLREKP